MKLVDYTVKNPMLGHLITLLAVVGGLIALRGMQRETFPEVSLDIVLVTTVFPNASPEEVEDLVTTPIEDEIHEIDGIDEYSSRSQEGLSYVMVKIDPELREADRVISEIQRKVDQIRLPDTAEDPEVEELTTDQPVINLVLTGGDDERALREVAEDLERKLEDLSGVAGIRRHGWRDEEFRVEIDPTKMNDLDISLDAVSRALALRNVNLPGGKLPEGNQELVLRTVGKFRTAQEMEQVIVRSNANGQAVRVGDVASVRRDFEENALFTVHRGKRAIVLGVRKRSDGDIIQVVDKVRELVKQEQLRLVGDVHIELVDDLSYYVRRRLQVVTGNGVVGIGLVLVCLLIFLNWRVAVMTAFGIPFSFLMGFILMRYFGLTINLMTLFAMIIVLGMIVDDAIIVGENIFRHLEMGKDRTTAVLDAVHEVAWPVVATVATTIAAFSPLYFAPDIYAKYLGWLVVVVVVTLSASLIECLLILPSHAVEFSGESEGSRARRNPPGAALMKGFLWLYRGGLRLSLKLRYLVFVGTVVGTVMIGGWLKDRLQIDLFPKDLIDIFTVSVTTASGSSLDHTEAVVGEIAAIIESLPGAELETTVSHIGQHINISDGSNASRGTQFGQVVVYLTPQETRERSTFVIIDELREKVGAVAGVERLAMDAINPGPPAGRPIEAKVVGSDFGAMRKAADALVQHLKSRPELEDVADDFESGKDELHVVVDEAEAARVGVSLRAVAQGVFTAYEGVVPTTVREGREDVDVKVCLAEPWRSEPASLEHLTLENRAGRLIQLSRVAGFERRPGLPSIAHFNGERVITVGASIRDKATDAFRENEALLAAFPNFRSDYPGCTLSLSGEWKETEKIKRFMFEEALPIAVGAIFCILAYRFRSFFQPFILLITIPLALVGVGVALVFHGKPVSIMAMMGMVGLAGVVVNDAIVLVSFINDLRDRGVPVPQAVFEAGLQRFRPILLTTITTTAGLFPVIFGIGGLEPFLVPAAITLTYGLICATFFNLVLVPCVYQIFWELGGKRSR